MRILYVHQHFCTPEGAGGTRSYEFARRFARAGCEVRVLSGTGYDPSLPDDGEIEIEGFRVRTLGVRYDNVMGFAQRIRSFVEFAGRSSLHAARAAGRYDVVLATSTPLTVALPALAARTLAGVPTVFEVRDVWPDAAVEAGVLKNPALIAAARMLETHTYNAVDAIVPLSTGMRDRILAKGPFGAKMHMIPNCSDIDRFRPDLDDGGLRAQFAAEDKFVLLYAGAVSLANDAEFLAGLIRSLAGDDGVQLWFVGGGNRLDVLREQARQCRAENVLFHGHQPKSLVPRFAAAADAGLVTFIPEPVYFENSPNKFFDYIAAGLPVLFNRDSWLAPWIREARCGWLCESRQVQEMLGYIRQLREDRALRERTGRNARRLAEEHFSRDRMAQTYLQLLAEVAGRRRSQLPWKL
jgi:glycosyltransferase involved in cell wall biosynthesis